ncbi:MAG: M48 family metalloprotease [Candidatus Obscuribacterales bacterium]|nr:M48 family metalloprotease [Candidatus Obscuribacterales bacterium]
MNSITHQESTVHSRAWRRMLETFAKTALGMFLITALVTGAMYFGHVPYTYLVGWNILWWAVIPMASWWFSADIAIKLQKCVPVDLSIPEHKRLYDLVHEVWLESGLKFEPPVYIADTTSPNAFATGPIHRKAKVAATKGLFLIGASDAEIKAVFAHELSHVKNYDVAINAISSAMCQVFFLITNQIVNGWLGSIKFLRRTVGLPEVPRRTFAVSTIISSIVMWAVFWVVSKFTTILQMFIVRSRESGADATGAHMTGDPCSLATALEKLVAYVETHRPQGVERERMRACRLMFTIDPLYDSLTAAPTPASIWSFIAAKFLGRFADGAKPSSVWQFIKDKWNYLKLSHPPVPERVAQLERINGGVCPRN